MKKYLLMATFLLSTGLMASDDLLSEIQSLESEFNSLAAQEEARFNEEKSNAMMASEGLAKNEAMYSELSARMQKLIEESNTRFYKNEYQALAKKYEKALEKLNAEMEVQKSVIADFEKIQALRGNN